MELAYNEIVRNISLEGSCPPMPLKLAMKCSRSNIEYACCFLCGNMMLTGTQRRYKESSDVANMLANHWETTPYVHNVLQNVVLREKKIIMCIGCLNWYLRSHYNEGHKREFRRNNKSLTPMDSVLMFLHFPGEFPKPDLRIFKRIINTLGKVCNYKRMTYGNPYSIFVPDYCYLTIRDMSRDEGVNKDAQKMMRIVVKAWWDSMGQPSILPNIFLAKMIRSLIQSEEYEVDEVEDQYYLEEQ